MRREIEDLGAHPAPLVDRRGYDRNRRRPLSRTSLQPVQNLIRTSDSEPLEPLDNQVVDEPGHDTDSTESTQKPREKAKGIPKR